MADKKVKVSEKEPKSVKKVAEKKTAKKVEKKEVKKVVKDPIETSFEKWFAKQEAALKEIRDIKKRMFLVYKAGVTKGKSIKK